MATEAQKARNKRKREKQKLKRKTGEKFLAEFILTQEGDELYQQAVNLLVDIDEGGNLIDDFDPEACLETKGHFGALRLSRQYVYFTPMQNSLFDIKGMRRHGPIEGAERSDGKGELVFRFPRKCPRLSQLEYMRHIVESPKNPFLTYDQSSFDNGKYYRDGVAKTQTRENGALKLLIW